MDFNPGVNDMLHAMPEILEKITSCAFTATGGQGPVN